MDGGVAGAAGGVGLRGRGGWIGVRIRVGVGIVGRASAAGGVEDFEGWVLDDLAATHGDVAGAVGDELAGLVAVVGAGVGRVADAAGEERAAVGVGAGLGEAVEAALVLSPASGAVGDFIGAHDLLGAVEGDVAVALDPLAWNGVALGLRAADVHGSAGIGVGAGAADDGSVGGVGCEGRLGGAPDDALAGHHAGLRVGRRADAAESAEQEGKEPWGCHLRVRGETRARERRGFILRGDGCEWVWESRCFFDEAREGIEGFTPLPPFLAQSLQPIGDEGGLIVSVH